MKLAKIIKLKLTNYKVFDDLYIKLNPCNVFVGSNSSGKSSIAEFLIFFRGLINEFYTKGKKSEFDFENFLGNAFRIGQDKSLIFEIKIAIGEYFYDYSVKFFTKPDTKIMFANESYVITKKQDNKKVFEASLNLNQVYPKIDGEMKVWGLGFGNYRSEIKKSFSYFQHSVLSKIYQENKPNNIHYDILNQFYEYWQNIRVYDFNIYDKKEICKETGISNEIILSEDFKNLMTVLLNISFQQKDIFKEIRDWLILLIPNFQDLIIQTSNEKGKAFPSFSEEGWDNKYTPLTQASDGIIRLLCILTILFNKSKPNLIILDEPENGIHPAIRNYIADFSIAASDDTQLILLTHDSESLRQFELEMIFYFKRKTESTEVRRLSDDKALTETIKALKDIEKNTVVSTHISDSL